jgi:hypothetical protein
VKNAPAKEICSVILRMLRISWAEVIALIGPRPFYTKMSTSDLFDACKKGDITRVRQAVVDGVDLREVVDENSVFN